MSYCRWSDDDFQCDLYCYADVMGGYTIHVASRRYKFNKPVPPRISWENGEEWLARQDEIDQMIKDADMVEIGLEFDGQTFSENTAHDFLVRLLKLRKAGYKFPDHILDAVKEETDNPEEE